MEYKTAKTLSIIVPVYYNEESLGELFERLSTLEQTLASRHVALELIFVDDGSRDNSFAVLLDIKRKRPATKLVKLTRNFGAIASSWSGFPYVTGDCVVVVVADLQDPPEQVLPMLDEWEHGYKLVFSHRRSRQDPWLSKVLAAAYYKVLDILVVRGFPEGGADMILMDKSLIPYALQAGRGVNYALYLFWLGFDVKLLAYDREARKYGKSRWTFKKKFFYFLDTITGFSVTPLRLLSLIGLAVSLLSFAYGIRLIVHALFSGIEVPGFVSLAVLISFSTGIIVAMLSILGEYLWRIFEIVSKHPKSVVAKAYLDSDVT
jgi:glycosyltransferase involved in cell wall biosynthesis